jgi:WD40 repeat protein
LLDVSTGEYRALFRGAAAWFLPPGHIVYYRAGTYHAIAFDLERLEVSGDPVQVLDDAADLVPQGDNRLAFSVSGEGTLAYGAFQPIPRSHLAWVEPGHEPRRLDLPAGSITSVAVSPDGREAVVASLESGVFVIHLLDLTTRTHELVDLDGSNWEPLWKPDGSGFAFLSMRKGDFDIYFKDARTRGPEQPIVVGETDESPLGWTLDGRGILANETQPDGSHLVKVFPTDGSARDPETILDTEGVGAASISPDGRWLAFSSSRGGTIEAYVKPYGPLGSGPEVRVSRHGGQRVAWSPDGTELYYTRGHAIVALGFEVDGDRFLAGEEQVLFESPLLFDYSGHPLATVGRRRFLVTLREEPPGGVRGRPEVRVVLNWQLEVEERFAEAARR